MNPSAEFDVYLASGSPRRRELLTQIGIRYEVLRVDVDETVLAGETPEDYVLRLALAKASAGKVVRQQTRPVLGADTTVLIDGELLGKPTTAKEGVDRLLRLSGRTHQVLTGIALLDNQEQTALSRSEVSFRTISLAEATAYWETGEPLDKAGGYAIQGRGALFVQELRGSYSGVMGLPLYEVGQLLAGAGINTLSKR